MRDLLKMRDLPLTSLGELLERVRCGRVEPVELPVARYYPPGSFHGDYVGFDRGILYWHPLAPVDTFAHEAAHAMLLDDPAGWEAMESAHIPTSEDAVMVLQCEIVRGLEGAGITRALADMESIGYCCLGREIRGRGRREVKPSTWWRSVGPRPPLPWLSGGTA